MSIQTASIVSEYKTFIVVVYQYADGRCQARAYRRSDKSGGYLSRAYESLLDATNEIKLMIDQA